MTTMPLSKARGTLRPIRRGEALEALGDASRWPSRYITLMAAAEPRASSARQGSTGACRARSGSPAPTRSMRAASRFGRSDPHADDIGADPGAPGWNLAPHGAGCRQMVFTGGQSNRAALREARSRPLGGLAALPAILSGVIKSIVPAKQETP